MYHVDIDSEEMTPSEDPIDCGKNPMKRKKKFKDSSPDVVFSLEQFKTIFDDKRQHVGYVYCVYYSCYDNTFLCKNRTRWTETRQEEIDN